MINERKIACVYHSIDLEVRYKGVTACVVEFDELNKVLNLKK